MVKASSESMTELGKYQLHDSYSCHVTRYTLHTKLNFTTGDSFCLSPLVNCINYTSTPWNWHLKGWNVLELRIVLMEWWFKITWVHLLVFIWYSLTTLTKFLANCGRNKSKWGTNQLQFLEHDMHMYRHKTATCFGQSAIVRLYTKKDNKKMCVGLEFRFYLGI